MIPVDTATLTKYLKQLCVERTTRDPVVEVLSRQSFAPGTYPAEIINCKLNSGKQITIRCKYSGGWKDKEYSHRKGINYEGWIYKDILQHLSLPTMPFYGFCQLMEQDESLLALGFFEDGCRMPWNAEKEVIEKVASWIGKLHRLYEGKVPPFVKVYDHEYFRRWANGARPLVHALSDRLEWLPNLLEYFLKNIPFMISSPQTLIHGELYQKNVLLRSDGEAIPIDWESAASSIGEIDLGSLIDSRDPDIVEAAVHAYRTARFANFEQTYEEVERRLILGRLYLYFRWLSEHNCDNLENFFSSRWVKVHLYSLAEKTNCV